jgi:hypothetical protein
MRRDLRISTQWVLLPVKVAHVKFLSSIDTIDYKEKKWKKSIGQNV